jgi:hypothetical protein
VVSFTSCTIDKETKSLQQETKEEERDCYYVFFPQGHSIRVTSYDELKRMGFHLKPRIVDMLTGDVVDAGGDPYDFGNDEFRDAEIVLQEDDDTVTKKADRRQKAETL